MTRVNTNIASFTAMNTLARSNKSLGRSLERLSTGYKINRAGDGPAALVISERLRSQISGLRQAVDNTQRARNMVGTAEAALVEVNTLLQSIQDLVLEAQNDGALSREEILANQAQVDDAIQTINRIATTSNFAGLDLLNGQAGYITSSVNQTVNAGTAMTGAGILDMKIHGAALQNGTSNISVLVNVRAAASQAIVSATGQTIPAIGSSLLISGNKGAELLEFQVGTNMSAIAAAVNTVTENTGVTASATGTTTIVFQSQFFGDDQFVNIKDINSPIVANQFISAFDEGRDIVANVNGVAAATEGNDLSINTFELDIEITLSSTFYAQNANLTSANTTFHVIGGGLAFQLGGGARPSEQAYLGIARVGADNLGSRRAGGFLSDLITGGKFTLLRDPETANKIMRAAIDDISGIRAKLGAFEANTLESNENSLNVAIENLTAAESRIRDTDFAVETAEFTRLQILVQAGTAVLAQANLLPQTVLSLLA
jgi:flagellin